MRESGTAVSGESSFAAAVMTNGRKEHSVEREVGVVIGGSLSQGVQVKLARARSVEDVTIGAYVAIEGQRNRSFGMITDVKLESMAPFLETTLPDLDDPFITEVMEGTAFYGIVDVAPTTVLDPETNEPRPVRTVPRHFSRVVDASTDDVMHVFGQEDESHLAIGKPLAMDNVDIVLDLKRAAERSVGVFGKSGTGKTFLVRQLLAGLVKSRLAATLVFDMHNEYGWAGMDRERNRQVKGLKQLFGSRVVVLTLDKKATDRRHVPTDGEIRIGYGEIEPEDIEALAEALGLTDAGKQLSYRLQRRDGRNWLKNFLGLEAEGMRELAGELGEHDGTMQALQRRLRTFERFDFLTEEAGNGSVDNIVGYLDRNMSVVLEFGDYGRHELAYMLVANLLTRRIHERYVNRSERAMGDTSAEPTPLVIAIEEAHKFLNRNITSQAIFGTIAREDRKHGVTLLVVDQRPSGIHDEVLSQIGTKLTCLLDSERDIEAILAGSSDRGRLRTVLARLESRQQALLMGDALPMPVVVQTREYGSEESYKALSVSDAVESAAEFAKERDSLFD